MINIQPIKLISIVILVLFQFGCGLTANKSVSTYNKVTIYYSDDNKYDKPRNKISLFLKREKSGFGTPDFELHGDREAVRLKDGTYKVEYILQHPNEELAKRECLKVVYETPSEFRIWGKEGLKVIKYETETVVEECIRNPVYIEYSLLYQEDLEYLSKIKELKKKLPMNYYEISKKLQANPSYNHNSCRLLPVKELPKRPKILCDNPSELAKERLSCLAPLGSKACQYLIEKIRKEQGKETTRTEKFLSGNACSLALKGKIDTSEVGIGLIEAAANSLIDDSGGFMDSMGNVVNGLLLVSRLYSSRSCLSGLIPNCEQKINNWKSKVAHIKAYPKNTKKQCDDLLSHYRVLNLEKNEIENKLYELEAKRKSIRGKMEEIKAKEYIQYF